MGTSHPELYQALRAEFEDTRVLNKTWTDKQTGERKSLPLHYITARQAMDRFDDVFGAENWWDSYTGGDRYVICRITVVFPDGKEVTKEGFGGFAGMEDEGDDMKSGESDAFKRAAVKFGIGRYLYSMNKPAVRPPGRRPNGAPQPARTEEPRRINALKELPKAGSGALYFWCKGLGEHYAAPVVDNVYKLAQTRGWAKEWKTWPQKQVDEVVRRVATFIKRMKNYDGALDWIKFEEQKPADLELLRDQIWTTACDLFAKDAPGVVLDPRTANELTAYYSDGKVQDLPTCSDVDAMNACLDRLTNALKK